MFGILNPKDAANFVYPWDFRAAAAGAGERGSAAAEGKHNGIVFEKEMGYVADGFTPNG